MCFFRAVNKDILQISSEFPPCTHLEKSLLDILGYIGTATYDWFISRYTFIILMRFYYSLTTPITAYRIIHLSHSIQLLLYFYLTLRFNSHSYYFYFPLSPLYVPGQLYISLMYLYVPCKWLFSPHWSVWSLWVLCMLKLLPQSTSPLYCLFINSYSYNI